MIEASFSVSLTLPPFWSISSFWLGLKVYGPDREGRVLALLVLAKLGADARQQHGEAERLRHIVVGAGFQAEDRVGIGVMPGKHDDRRLVAALPQDLDRLAPVHVRQADIHDEQVDQARRAPRRCLWRPSPPAEPRIPRRATAARPASSAGLHRRRQSGWCGRSSLNPLFRKQINGVDGLSFIRNVHRRDTQSR